MTARHEPKLTWQTALLRDTFKRTENRPRVMKSKKLYSRKGRKATGD